MNDHRVRRGHPRRSARLGWFLGIALFVPGLLFAGGPALGQESDPPPITLPPPPVTLPPLEPPGDADPVMAPIAPTASYACSVYASGVFSTEFVSGVVFPLIFDSATGGSPPADLRSTSQYLAMVAGACGAVPPHTTPTRCAVDDQMSAQFTEAFNDVLDTFGLNDLKAYLSVALPATGMLIDSIAALEGSPASESTIAQPLFDGLDCRTVSDEDAPAGTRQPGTPPAPATPDPEDGAAIGDATGAAPTSPVSGAASSGPPGATPPDAGQAAVPEASTVGRPVGSFLGATTWRWQAGYLAASIALGAVLLLTVLGGRFRPER